MKTMGIVLTGLVAITVVGVGLSYAQPKTPKESIPSNIASKIRDQIEHLYSSDPVERANAVIAIGRMGTEATPAVPYLIDMLGDNSPLAWVSKEYGFKMGATFSCRNLAISALGRIRDPRAVGPLISSLNDGDDSIRMDAVAALQEIGEPSSIEALIFMISDTNYNVRSEAVRALDQINANWRGSKMAKQAVPKFVAALKDKDSSIRQGAAYGLGIIKDPRAVEPLIETLKDNELFVQYTAKNALVKITNLDFGQDIIEWQGWWEKNKAKYEKPARNGR